MTWVSVLRTLLPNWHNRRLEWGLTFYLLFLSLVLLAPAASMQSPTYRGALEKTNELGWALIFGSEGVLLYVTLQVNGRAAWTPFLRGLTLLLVSQTFFSFAISLAKVQSLGLTFASYLFISLGFCGIAFSTAAFDCGREIKVWRSRHGKR